VIDFDRNIIFTHPKKCGGTTIEAAFGWKNRDFQTKMMGLLSKSPDRHLKKYAKRVSALYGLTKHAGMATHVYIAEKFRRGSSDEFFKFTCVRNPWDAAVSLFFFMKYNRFMSFEDFINSHYAHYLGKPHYLSYLLEPHYGFLDVEKFLFVGPQYTMDYIIRYETYADDCAWIYNTFDIRPPKKAKHAYSRPAYSKDYKVMYKRDDIIEQVAQLAESSIRLFGYTF